MPKVIETICNIVTKIVAFILNTGIMIINFISSKMIQLYNFLFEYICILDNDIRRDIFIGVTGITIAIVIFIAEVISNKKNELEKKLILSITKIKRNTLCPSLLGVKNYSQNKPYRNQYQNYCYKHYLN